MNFPNRNSVICKKCPYFMYFVLFYVYCIREIPLKNRAISLKYLVFVWEMSKAI